MLAAFKLACVPFPPQWHLAMRGKFYGSVTLWQQRWTGSTVFCSLPDLCPRLLLELAGDDVHSVPGCLGSVGQNQWAPEPQPPASFNARGFPAICGNPRLPLHQQPSGALRAVQEQLLC